MSVTAEAPAPIDTFDGRYSLVRELGVGGVGRVWEALHAHTGRCVALKTLRPELANEPRWAQRFLREARAVARIRHPNVVEVLDMRAGDAPFIVYELLEGEGLDARLAAAPEGRLDVDAALCVMVPVAAALAAAHAEGIVHRDLKPSNVFLSRDARGDEVPKVIDFGLAKHARDDVTVTTSDVVVGTPAYMSPEQARSEPDVDHQADVWSFGATLYECLAGVLPVDGPNANAVLGRLLREEVRPLRVVAPDVPDDVAAVVDRCLLRDRAQRFGAMRDVVDALMVTSSWKRAQHPSPVLSCTRAERTPPGATVTAPAHAPHPDVSGTRRTSPPPSAVAPRGGLWMAVALVAVTAALVGSALTRWRLGDAHTLPARTTPSPAPIVTPANAAAPTPTAAAPAAPAAPIAAVAPRRVLSRARPSEPSRTRAMVVTREAPPTPPTSSANEAPAPPRADPLEPDRRYP